LTPLLAKNSFDLFMASCVSGGTTSAGSGDADGGVSGVAGAASFVSILALNSSI